MCRGAPAPCSWLPTRLRQWPGKKTRTSSPKSTPSWPKPTNPSAKQADHEATTRIIPTRHQRHRRRQTRTPRRRKRRRLHGQDRHQPGPGRAGGCRASGLVDFESLAATARRIIESAGIPVKGLFFELHVDVGTPSDDDVLGHLEYRGRHASYVLERQSQ